MLKSMSRIVTCRARLGRRAHKERRVPAGFQRIPRRSARSRSPKERINPLPGALAEPRDRSFAAALGNDPGRVKAEKDHEAKNQNRHGQSA